jgi:hypothetical protein
MASGVIAGFDLWRWPALAMRTSPRSVAQNVSAKMPNGPPARRSDKRSRARCREAIASSLVRSSALFNRQTHHVHILELNGESYMLKHSRSRACWTTHRPSKVYQWVGGAPPIVPCLRITNASGVRNKKM